MKRRWMAIGVILALLCAVVAVLFSRPREPSYASRPMSEWLQTIESTSAGDGDHVEALHAARQFDARAVPWLLHELDAKDFVLGRFFGELFQLISRKNIYRRFDTVRRRQAVLGFELLGPTGETAMPTLLRSLQNPDHAGDAAGALAGIAGTSMKWRRIQSDDGTGRLRPRTNILQSLNDPRRTALRHEVLTHFARFATNESWQIRHAVVVALGRFDEDARMAAPVLIARLDDEASWIRATAAHALGELRAEPASVVPALIKALHDAEDGVRASAASALIYYHENSDALAAIPSLQKLLADPDRRVCDAAKRALLKIAPNVILRLEGPNKSTAENR